MKKKISLNDLTVTSFVTKKKDLLGGKPPITETNCPDFCFPTEDVRFCSNIC